ncbi:hypothetical protein [Planktotalea sp.]|uniref:hypothetical protein n=1 Tax=Planktotalea sp. TaxID=2029877 RepID=UPI0032988434
MSQAVVCPIALHPDGAPLRVPAYLHPQNGLEIIKDTLQSEDHIAHEAAQVLFRLSSLETRHAIAIGQSQEIETGVTWHFALCRLAPVVRDMWQNVNPSDGTLLKFQWFDLSDSPALSQTDTNALKWVRNAL